MKLLALIVCGGWVANCAVTLPALIADHMVLQRDLPVHIWGMADAKESVKVSLAGSSATAIADGFGRWQVNLRPMKAGGPYTVEIEAQIRITLTDVMVGDVWVASG